MWTFFAVLSVAGLTAVASLQCSEDFVQRHGSVFAVPGSCEEYLECVDGELTKFNCPLGTLFDVDLNECSSDPQAKCSEETVADGLCGEADKASALPDPYNCARYALCLGEFSIARQCEHGLLFNSVTRVCETAQNAVCKLTCPAEGDEAVYLPDSTGQNCARYYICLNGTPQAAECSSMQYFDLVTGSCTAPADASCRVRGVTCSEVDELIANPESCSSYYKCEEGFPHFMECDVEQHFFDGQCVPGDCNDLVTEEPEVTTEDGPSTVTTGLPSTTPEITTEVSTATASTVPTPTDSPSTVTTESPSTTDSPSTITTETPSATPDITTELSTADPTPTDSPSTITTELPSVTPEITTEPSTVTDSTPTDSPSTVTTESPTVTTPTDTPSTITTETPATTVEITTEVSTVTPEITTELSTATDSPSTITTELPSITPDITTEPSTVSPSTIPTPTDSPSTVTTESPTPEITTASTATVEPSTVTVESSTSTDSPSTDPAVVCQGVGIGLLAHPFNCYQYFVCIFDVGRLFSCAAGQIFDPLLVCVAGNRETCVPTSRRW